MDDLSFDLTTLSSEEMELVLALASDIVESGDVEKVKHTIDAEDYIETPVTPEEFFSEPYYIGPFAKSLYSTWREELCYVLAPENQIKEWVIYGSLGCGKSTAAICAQLYTTYLLGCMKSPQKAYGLAEHFPIYLAFFNITKAKAQDSLARKFETILNFSPYFREKFPKNMRRVFLPNAAAMFGAGYREHPKKEDLYQISLPHNVHLLFGSRTQHVLSLDIFSAVLDEMNFRVKKSVLQSEDEDSAEFLYNQIQRRIASRFLDHPGLLINISSAKAHTSFIEQRIEDIRKGDIKHVHISDFALWEIKKWRYTSGKNFQVFVGSGYKGNRILAEDEVDTIELHPGERIVHVPEEHREDFESNVDMALRDIAGVATAAVNRLFNNPEIINQAVALDRENPVQPETLDIGLRNKDRIEHHFDTDFVSYYNNIERLLNFHRGVSRFIHVDLSKTGDHTGICGGCIPKFFERKTKNEHDQEVIQRLPFLFVDFFVGIRAPKGDQIDYEKVRQFLLWLRETPRYNIVRISYDSYQSVHSLQMLETAGIETETISVDRTDEPYLELYNAFLEHRVSIPKHSILLRELRDLIHDITGRVGNVDHARGNSKDIADSLCGMYANVLSYYNKHSIKALGAVEIVDWSLKDHLVSPKPKIAAKISKEMGFKEPVFMDVPQDTKLRWY